MCFVTTVCTNTWMDVINAKGLTHCYFWMQINHMAVLWEVVVGFVAGWLPTGCQPPINGKKITEKKIVSRGLLKKHQWVVCLVTTFCIQRFQKEAWVKPKNFNIVAKTLMCHFRVKKPPAGCHKTKGFNSIEERWLLSLKWVEVFYKKETNTKSKVQKKNEKYQGEKKDTNG